MTKVGAVVVEYRSTEHTIACLRELLRQQVDQIAVVDNSDDGKASLSKLRQVFELEPRVLLEDAGRNLGFAAAVNRGFERLARGESCSYVLVINNDAFPGPEMVARLVQELQRTPDSIVAFPKVLHAGRPLAEIYYHRWFAVISGRPFPGAFRVPRGCCMLVAASHFPGPLFDETFFMYGEEIALGWTLRKRAYALAYVPECVVVHHGSASAELGSQFYEERTAAAHLLLSHLLVERSAELPLLVMVRTTAVVCRALLRAARARSWLPTRALWAGRKIAKAALSPRQ